MNSFNIVLERMIQSSEKRLKSLNVKQTRNDGYSYDLQIRISREEGYLEALKTVRNITDENN